MKVMFMYRLYNRAGDLLYIGISDHPNRRFEQHAHGKGWWREVVLPPEVEQIPADAAHAIEREAIERLHPRYNVKHNVKHNEGREPAIAAPARPTRRKPEPVRRSPIPSIMDRPPVPVNQEQWAPLSDEVMAVSRRIGTTGPTRAEADLIGKLLSGAIKPRDAS